MNDTPIVAQLAERYWHAVLEADPLHASFLGDHRFADALPDPREEMEQVRIETYRALAAQAGAIDPGALDEESRITLEIVREDAAAEADLLEAALAELQVAPAMVGPQVHLYEMCPALTLPSRAEAEGLLARYRRTDRWFADASARLDAGLAKGRAPAVSAVTGAVRHLDGLLARPVAADPLLAPAAPPDLAPAAAARWRQELAAAVEEVVRPALVRYRDHLAQVVAPRARPAERPGLSWIPGGGEAYAAATRRFTSLPVDPVALHALGREEVARLAEEYAELGGRTLGTAEVREIFARLRTDASLRFSSAAEVLGHAERALTRAQEAVGDWFGLLPRTPCVVREMAAHEVEDGTIAYYLPPAGDGSRPGGYHVNTYRPGTRTRFESEALAFHESVPGHHLQIALAQERTDLPPLRRNLPVNAYVEGWALYTERLADEMGLYSGDLERLGMLSFDSWRACRLVVDTGLHHLGWSRQQGIDYLLAHSPQAENNIVNEVDRYIVWPGQALGYKVGQRTIAALRDEARQALGARFDIRRFHDAVLAPGAVPLGVLQGIVRRWVASS